MNDRQKYCAVVGVVGRTNSGKSTLINRIVGEKVSIVSPVVQTTRNTVRAVLTRDAIQLVFLDTPGLHKAESALGTLMNRMARASSAGADILAVVFDASHRVHQEDEGWMNKALKLGTPLVFVLNKADKAGFDPRPFREIWQRLTDPLPEKVQAEWIECSAVRKGGADALIGSLSARAQPSDDFLFPEDIVTDYPRKLAIADTIREKFLPRLRDEIPHELGIFVEHIQETPSAWDISATVYVSRPSQKGIVIGPKGTLLKEVRQKAERELSEIYGVRVRIELWVKVEKNWFKNLKILEQMGYAGRL